MLLRCLAMSRQRIARPAALRLTIRRRPPRVRSRAGPSTGATTAKGTMVMARYRSTLGRAESAETLKKIDPARATATSVSAPTLTAWARARRGKPLGSDRTGDRLMDPRRLPGALQAAQILRASSTEGRAGRTRPGPIWPAGTAAPAEVTAPAGDRTRAAGPPGGP